MRKFFFAVFIILLNLPVWGLTITCTDKADTRCKVPEIDKIETIKNCNEIKEISGSTVLRYPYNMISSCRNMDRDENNNENCPYVVHTYTYSKTSPDNYDIIAFCITNKDIVLEYTDDQTTSWSYDQKKCVGSGGKWINDSCDCNELLGTQSVNNECLCTNNPRQQYFNKIYSGCETLKNGVLSARDGSKMMGFGDYDLASIDKANSCSPSGGEWGGPDENVCNCKEALHMKRHSSEYFCECKQNYQYKDPLRKSQGCVPINQTTSIVGTVTDAQQKPLPGVNVYVADSTTHNTYTNTNGTYELSDVPNTAQISFSLQGYETKTIHVDYLTNNKTIVLPTTNYANKSEAPATTDECTQSGGTPDTNNECTCDINNKQKQNEQKTKCVCTDGFTRENDTGSCEPIEKGGNGAEDETGDTKANTNTELQEKLKSAKDALAAAQEKENSWANRGITAASSAMTGLGGMQLAEGIAERRADAEAEKEMRAYIETMHCEYGGGQNIKLGNEEITLPGGNELLEYYTEYKSLADNLKTTKTALGLRPGIESETLYDRAQTGLYQYASIGKTGGAETSLYRALTDSESADAAAWAEQKDASNKKLKVGAIVAGAGVATGIVGNYLINGHGKTKLQQELDENIEEILPPFAANIERPEIDVSTPESKLDTSGTNNKKNLQIARLNIPSYPVTNDTFDTDSAYIKDPANLDNYITRINTIMDHNHMTYMQKIHFNIVGHTDRTGTETYNKTLSHKRAESVQSYLEKNLRVPSEYFTVTYSTEGKGFDECPKTQKKNNRDCRRVDITVIDETEVQNEE